MSIHPNVHKCDVTSISYEQVKDGTIWCKSCGRIWDLTEWGWKPDPPPPTPPGKWQGKKR